MKHKLGLVFGVVLMLAASVSGLAVSVGENLELYPGQTLDKVFDIQNVLEGASPVTLKGTFTEGAEIASFGGDSEHTITVPGGEILPVPVRFSIPDTATIGTVYDVEVFFESTSIGEGSGNIGLSQNVKRSMSVTVVAEPPEPADETSTPQEGGIGVVAWIIIIIVIILVIWYIIKRKKAA